jgi:hypothetical protein
VGPVGPERVGPDNVGAEGPELVGPVGPELVGTGERQIGERPGSVGVSPQLSLGPDPLGPDPVGLIGVAPVPPKSGGSGPLGDDGGSNSPSGVVTIKVDEGIEVYELA